MSDCDCQQRRILVDQSRGNCGGGLIKSEDADFDKDDTGLPPIVHSCRPPEGGTMTCRPQTFVLTVTNPPGINGEGVLDLFQDEIGEVIVDDTLDPLVLNR